MDAALHQLEVICDILDRQGFDNVRLDFSIVNDMNYYNGILFRGYVEGIPTGVLSGGQYDELMEKMGKKAGAIGFAIYLDLLEDYESSSENYDIDALLLYDDTSEPGDVMDAVRHLT